MEGSNFSKLRQDQNFDYRFLRGKLLRINHSLPGVLPATAANYGVFFIADLPCYVVQFQESHEVVGSDGGGVTVGLEKLTGTTAPGSGTSVLESELSLKATINTVQTGTLSATLASRQLAKGDRLAIDDTGVLTAVAGLVTTTIVRYRD